MMVERHRLFAALRSVTWMDVCGDGLHASIGIGVLSLRKADGGTALIEDIHCEKIRGCSYRGGNTSRHVLINRDGGASYSMPLCRA